MQRFYLRGLEGVQYDGMDNRFRQLICDDIDSGLLGLFGWSMVVSNGVRFVEDGFRPSQIVVRACQSGRFFYPHHLVAYCMSVEQGLKKLVQMDAGEKYAALSGLRQRSVRCLNGIKMDVRRENLRIENRQGSRVVTEENPFGLDKSLVTPEQRVFSASGVEGFDQVEDQAAENQIIEEPTEDQPKVSQKNAFDFLV